MAQNGSSPDLDRRMRKYVFSQFGAEWASAALVFVVAMIAGRMAADGMSLMQWAGALTAILGSITVAVAVRVWAPEKSEA
jgi:hypothetical protein